MSWLSKFKKKEEVVDLVELKKRGLIEDKDLGIEQSMNSGNIMDLSSSQQQAPQQASPSSGSDSNPLGFLAGLAGGVGSDLSSESSSSEVDESNKGLGFNQRKTRLKHKIKEMETRIDSLSNQLQKAVDRLELMERKLERKGI